MHEIEMGEVSPDFAKCWQAAGQHLQSMPHDNQINWLKSDLTPPFLEHLSFRLGNQLFYIRVIDIEHSVSSPGNSDGYRLIAEGCNGNACLMPMRKTLAGWVPAYQGWGLIDEDSEKVIDPINLVSDEKIIMTDWELHDFAVQIVRKHIANELGFELMSSHSNPEIRPSVWFVGEEGPEWVIVQALRYPDIDADSPTDFSRIAASCAHVSHKGSFASVSFANNQDPFDSADPDSALPLWRGHGVFVRFQGLVTPVT